MHTWTSPLPLPSVLSQFAFRYEEKEWFLFVSLELYVGDEQLLGEYVIVLHRTVRSR